jgi:transposase InsO family protein
MRDGHNTESWRLSIIIADYSGAAQRAAAVRSRRSRVVVAPIAGRPRGCYHRGDACRQEGGEMREMRYSVIVASLLSFVSTAGYAEPYFSR